VLRNPWVLAQAADLAAGRTPRRVTLQERGAFLLAYMDLLINERVGESSGFRHVAPQQLQAADAQSPVSGARGRERWVINKVRALCAWYSKGFDHGSQFRVRVNHAASLPELRDIIDEFFFAPRPELAEAGR
jgi:tRNA-dihydrouridine synthase